MVAFTCVRCADRRDTDDGYSMAPQHSNQPPGSLFCAECLSDLESREKELKEFFRDKSVR